MTEIETELQNFAAANPIKDAIISVQLRAIKSSQSITLTNRKIKEILKEAVHVIIKRQFSNDSLKNPGISQKVESLDRLMKDFILENVEEKEKAEALVSAAQKYIHLYETGEYNKR